MKRYNQELIHMFEDAQHLLFYKVMKYPVPKQYKIFLTKKNTDTQAGQNLDFSRKHRNPYMDEYINHINKFRRIFKNIPFVQEIYLCNSMSFNALKDGSDIDLFFVCKRGALRRARFFSVAAMTIMGAIRKRKIRKKFCMTFYITPEAKNLYQQSLPKTDIYLAYWLAHLIPLYQEELNQPENIYHHNQWLKQILPNIQNQHHINLAQNTIHGAGTGKKIIEFLINGLLGKLVEKLIKGIRSPIVIKKKKALGEKGKGIVINNHTLKFYYDKREKIRLLYQIEKKL